MNFLLFISLHLVNLSLLVTGPSQGKTPSSSVASQAPQEESGSLSLQRPLSLLPSQHAPSHAPFPPSSSTSHPVSHPVSNSANAPTISTASTHPLYGPALPVQRKAGRNLRAFFKMHPANLTFSAPLISHQSLSIISLTKTSFIFTDNGSVHYHFHFYPTKTFPNGKKINLPEK